MRRGVGLACVLGLLAPAVGACGGPSDRERFSLTTPGSDVPIVREIDGSQKPRRGKPTSQELSVIRRWAAALRAGHVKEASAVFTLPAVVYDGRTKRRVARMAGIRAFNRAMPCGARFVKAQRAEESFVTATFRLTER